MQDAAAAEPGGRRPAQQQQFAGVDLRRPKGYAAPAPAKGYAAPAPAEGHPCPRCESRDTKFCYYNNYNTSQPRHFCKGCRRYWTKGGTLRNVPVGGGTRKKPASSSPPSSYAAAAIADKPRKPSKKKRRVVAPPEPVSAAAATVVAAPAADPAKATTNETTKPKNETTTPTTTTDAASEITTELVVPAAEEEDSLAHLLLPDVALGLGIPDFPAAGKALDLESDSFEWPASFDLGGACWGSAAFADPDPAGLFLNLP